jgi:hypothetical protein
VDRVRLGVDGSIGEEEQVEIRCQSGSNKRQLSPSVEVDVRVGKSLLIGTVALGVTVGAANPVAQDPPSAAAVEDDRADPARWSWTRAEFSTAAAAACCRWRAGARERVVREQLRRMPRR